MDFELISNGRSAEDNRNRLQELLSYADIYRVGEFRNLCEKILFNLNSEFMLQDKKNEINIEFYDEIRSKKKIDLKDYYKTFLQKKRHLKNEAKEGVKVEAKKIKKSSPSDSESSS